MQGLREVDGSLRRRFVGNVLGRMHHALHTGRWGLFAALRVTISNFEMTCTIDPTGDPIGKQKFNESGPGKIMVFNPSQDRMCLMSEGCA